MTEPSLFTAMETLWRAAGGPSPLPDLGREPLEALIGFLAMGHEMAPGLERWRLEDQPDPFPAIALGLSPAEAELRMAVQTVGLIPFRTPWVEDLTLYVDPLLDKKKRHRVYAREEKTLPGRLHASFGSIEEALVWLCPLAEGKKQKEKPRLADAWEQEPSSAGFLLERLLLLSPVRLWEALRKQQWPAPPVPLQPQAVKRGRAAGWQRRLCLSLLEQLWTERQTTLPEGLKARDLLPEQLAFCQHLLQLGRAAQGDVPPLMMDFLKNENRAVQEGAARWIEEFTGVAGTTDGAEEELDTDEEEGPGGTSFEAVLAPRLSRAISGLRARGMIELESENHEDLVDDLVERAAGAGDPATMLDRILEGLMDSRWVEEVFANDEDLRKVIVAALH